MRSANADHDATSTCLDLLQWILEATSDLSASQPRRFRSFAISPCRGLHRANMQCVPNGHQSTQSRSFLTWEAHLNIFKDEVHRH